MKKILLIVAGFSLVGVGLLAGCQKKEMAMPPETMATNAPAAPAPPATPEPGTNAPAAPAPPQ